MIVKQNGSVIYNGGWSSAWQDTKASQGVITVGAYSNTTFTVEMAKTNEPGMSISSLVSIGYIGVNQGY